jgi:non-ribosomal peptide synthetase component E (peptide arylation enzyme)
LFGYTENGYMAAANNVIDQMNLKSSDVLAVIAPIAQGIGQLAGFAAATLTGCKVVLVPHFDPDNVLEIMDKQRVTAGVIVPTMISKMISVPRREKYDLKALRVFLVAGDLLSPLLAKRFEELFNCKIVSTYGAAEGPIPLSSRLEDHEEIRHNTVGSLNPGHEIKIIDPKGNSLPSGEVGEIVGRGPSTSSGYFEDHEATKRAFTKDGWFKFGDLGYIDEHGFARIVGRKKDIIIRGGQNIAPKEIEEMLMHMPQIAEVAVVGVPDQIYGERSCACIVLKNPDGKLTLKDITSFLRNKNLATYKLPERIEILKTFPRSGGQKIQKKLLVETVLKKLKKIDNSSNNYIGGK